MRITPSDLARRFAEADRRVRLLRRATREMQGVRHHLLATRARDDQGGRDRIAQVHRIALLGGDTDTGLNVLDLVAPRSARYRTSALARSVAVPLRGRSIHALSAEDFVLFKALATRDRDVDDAASVLRRSPEILDMDLIEQEVRRLTEEIPDWDVRLRWTLIQNRGAAGAR